MALAHEPSVALQGKASANLAEVPELARAPAVFRTALKIIARGWSEGSVTFVLPRGGEIRIRGAGDGPSARIQVHDYRFMKRVMTAGDIGFAEGYMAGEWDTPDLSAVLEAMSRNFEGISRVALGGPLAWIANFVGHLLNDNSRSGSKRNIHAHYDLGNAFYSRWLDPTMTYSAARFERPGEELTEAQRNKYRALGQVMDLRPEHRVLEIGCGWGGFAEFAARDVGARVTAITISKEQYEFASRRLFEQGLGERAEVKLIDYRDVEGRFDRVASIEMFEAVGERHWPEYFAKVHGVLGPQGRAGLQIITIRDEFFDLYRRRADFIQKYIFPGGMLPSERRLREETERAGLSWREISRFGQNYADTLAEWGRRFEGAWDEIRHLGFDERFRRLWKFYLSYCEAGFRTERTNVVQLSLARG
jgi:cyclopropane-fatty-acyl-phospholipid synthase